MLAGPHGHPVAVQHLGDIVGVRAFVALGELGVDDVDVQVVHGRVTGDDELVSTTVAPMALSESYEGDRHRFDLDLPLERSGAFGYTVRVVPRHPSLASVAELGLVAVPG